MSRTSPVAELVDRTAISDVLHRYCRAIDRCDAELLRSCYHPDAVDHHGPIRGRRDEFVDRAISELTLRAASHGQLTTHVLGNVIIDLDGDAAAVESYFQAAHVEDRDEGFRVFEFHGRYLDRFERRDGEWRIARRTVVHDWSEIRSSRRGLRPGQHAYVQGVAGSDEVPEPAAALRSQHDGDHATRTGMARHIVCEYLAALDEGDFDRAAACFAEDGIYCVPTAPGSSLEANDGAHWCEGRAAIRAHFARRGVLPIRHEIDSILIDGDQAAVRGTVALDDTRAAVFLSWAQVDAAGLLSRYVATAITLPADHARTLLGPDAAPLEGREER